MNDNLVTVAPGIEGILQTDGCIFSTALQGYKGYPPLKTINGKRIRVSRLVLEHKLGRSIKPGCFACHSCDNPLCINPEHLWEGTAADNLKDAISKGRFSTYTWFKKGYCPPNRKLTFADASAIRELSSKGFKATELARDFGVSKSVVYRIIKGECYAQKEWVDDSLHSLSLQIESLRQQIAEMKSKFDSLSTRIDVIEGNK